MLTCLGDADDTVAALLTGASGVAPLRFVDTEKLFVGFGYPIDDGDRERSFRASSWLTETVADAVRESGLDVSGKRVAVVVGSGLRELRSLERWHADGAGATLRELHFDAAVRAVLPEATEVLTVSNACSAGGYALALALDLLALDEADAVVVAGCDSMTESMLTMIGRVGDELVTELRPFDRDRGGVLLGEGAAALVLEREPADGRPVLARILGVGLSCDAHHETAPDVAGIVAAMRDAHTRAGVAPEDIDLVLAHGTGTALNDPTEARALTEVFAEAGGGLVTAIKGATGHTSGGAALMSLLVAVEAMRRGRLPAVIGLADPIDEAADLAVLAGESVPIQARIAQVNAFGFGGVNAVTIVEV
ncbi:beta-ketoacyl synthase [Solihabitans fulvus]|uniref:Beta-ketoacyl synthase n=1 Tax=Solihabitans fulvus TaxID=1892852 RepID=A0A5B2WRY6_9PSEU|nr:beta-ketoacyl synthase N-terminal-like domain-containing protein [Solihabitans fulvus]KAA2254451.1 beta-ketoacyl synthase [Solihabitans fulvus]